jgi:hypothetical protein
VFREWLGGRAVVVQRKTSLGEGLGDFLMVPTLEKQRIGGVNYLLRRKEEEEEEEDSQASEG